MKINVKFLNANTGDELLKTSFHTNAAAMRSAYRYAGSMKVAKMDAQFGLYMESPRKHFLRNGRLIPSSYAPERLTEKEVATSVTGNLGEMVFGQFLIDEWEIRREELSHLHAHGLSNPDLLAKIGPEMSKHIKTTVRIPKWWPIEVKTGVGSSPKKWRRAALDQLQSFWGRISGSTLTAPNFGLAVLFRRGAKRANLRIWVYFP